MYIAINIYMHVCTHVSYTYISELTVYMKYSKLTVYEIVVYINYI